MGNTIYVSKPFKLYLLGERKKKTFSKWRQKLTFGICIDQGLDMGSLHLLGKMVICIEDIGYEHNHTVNKITPRIFTTF